MPFIGCKGYGENRDEMRLEVPTYRILLEDHASDTVNKNEKHSKKWSTSL